MFEKEAEEYADTESKHLIEDNEGNIINIAKKVRQAFRDGAEFGYNKANEWHYHEIPTDYTKPYLCKVIHPTKNDMTDYEILFYDEKEISWFRWLMPWDGGESNTSVRINRKVIAWKEIDAEQIAKTKELIEKLLNAFASNDFFEEEELDAMAEAEQFLKEIKE